MMQIFKARSESFGMVTISVRLTQFWGFRMSRIALVIWWSESSSLTSISTLGSTRRWGTRQPKLVFALPRCPSCGPLPSDYWHQISVRNIHSYWRFLSRHDVAIRWYTGSLQIRRFDISCIWKANKKLCILLASYIIIIDERFGLIEGYFKEFLEGGNKSHEEVVFVSRKRLLSDRSTALFEWSCFPTGIIIPTRVRLTNVPGKLWDWGHLQRFSVPEDVGRRTREANEVRFSFLLLCPSLNQQISLFVHTQMSILRDSLSLRDRWIRLPPPSYSNVYSKAHTENFLWLHIPFNIVTSFRPSTFRIPSFRSLSCSSSILCLNVFQRFFALMFQIEIVDFVRSFHLCVMGKWLWESVRQF